MVGFTGGLAACGSVAPVEPAGPPVTDPTQLYMRLAFDHPAVTMSTASGYNTLSLTATPRDAQDIPMNGLPAPTYRSTDTTRVRVTADGMISAVSAGSGIMVIAELAAGPVRHADTALVDVTTEMAPPVLTTFAISPDSAVWPIAYNDAYMYNGTSYPAYGVVLGLISGILQYSPSVVPVMKDANGSAMSLPQVEYRSLNQAIATVDRRGGGVTPLRPGRVRMVAQTTAYGVSKIDTLTYTVTLPTIRTVSIHPDSAGTPIFGWRDVAIPPYGVVLWVNYLSDSVDVTFDGPVAMTEPPAAFCGWVVFFPASSCGMGDALLAPVTILGDVPYQAMQARQFPTPGTYLYHSTRTGATGRIVVAGAE